MNNIPTDYFNNDIHVGDIVAYPGRSGSSLWMNHGKVIEVVCKKRHEWSDETVTKLRVEKLGTKTTRRVMLECFSSMINLSAPLQIN